MFYRYHQNNSGGRFSHNEQAGIGYEVAIEADTAEDANCRAESIGLYFDGSGDCECCGSRWSRAWDWPGSAPKADDHSIAPTFTLKGGWGIPSYVHYKSGMVQKVEDKSEATINPS